MFHQKNFNQNRHSILLHRLLQKYYTWKDKLEFSAFFVLFKNNFLFLEISLEGKQTYVWKEANLVFFYKCLNFYWTNQFIFRKENMNFEKVVYTFKVIDYIFCVREILSNNFCMIIQ